MNILNNLRDLLRGKAEPRPAEGAPAKTEMKPAAGYYSYYLFGRSVDKPIWHWDHWQRCLPLLQPIIDLSPDLPSVKTTQTIPVTYGKDGQYTSHNKGELKFGAMKWSEAHNRKWATQYAGESGWQFFDTEISYPSRSKCNKEGLSPRLIITITNENLSSIHDRPIDQSVTISIHESLVSDQRLGDLEKDIYQIGAILHWKIAGKIKRPSAFSAPYGGYTDSIWDGSRGVLDINDWDFSTNFKKYGIEKIAITN